MDVATGNTDGDAALCDPHIGHPDWLLLIREEPSCCPFIDVATGKIEGDAKPELCIDVATGRTAGIGGMGDGT